MQTPEQARLEQKGIGAIYLFDAKNDKKALVGEGEAVSPCPNCGAMMNGIRGSKGAICQNCGFKDSCCF